MNLSNRETTVLRRTRPGTRSRALVQGLGLLVICLGAIGLAAPAPLNVLFFAAVVGLPGLFLAYLLVWAIFTAGRISAQRRHTR